MAPPRPARRNVVLPPPRLQSRLSTAPRPTPAERWLVRSQTAQVRDALALIDFEQPSKRQEEHEHVYKPFATSKDEPVPDAWPCSRPALAKHASKAAAQYKPPSSPARPDTPPPVRGHFARLPSSSPPPPRLTTSNAGPHAPARSETLPSARLFHPVPAGQTVGQPASTRFLKPSLLRTADAGGTLAAARAAPFLPSPLSASSVVRSNKRPRAESPAPDASSGKKRRT